MRVYASPGAVAVLALGLLVLVPLPGDGAAADCATPLLRFADGRTDARVAPGETVTVTGAGYVEGCDDGGDPDFACAPPLHEQPSEGVELWLRQSGEQRLLGTADARNVGDDLGRVSWSFVVPADAAEGRATLLPHGGAPLAIHVVAE